jgi:hypothetical protein
MSGSSMSAADIIRAVDKGDINWANVWWVEGNVREVAMDHLTRVMSGPTDAEILVASALMGLEWFFWKRPLK